MSFRIAALAVCCCAAALAQVKTGLDVLVERGLAPLAGKRVGVVTNHSSLTSDRRWLVDILAESKTVNLGAIFTPEHGLSGVREDTDIRSGVDQRTGAPLFSLYEGQQRRPKPEMLSGLDAVVFDMQDAGVRFYTFITTLGYMLEAAAQQKIPFFVLDRPNPINGVDVSGPMLDEKYISFVAYMRMPIRHGMTIGELARMYNGEKKLGAPLEVIKMEGWKRSMWFDETGLEWVNPSPNLRNLTQTVLYPGACLLESKVVSVGRGTDTPFQLAGAPWMKAREMARYLNSLSLPGIRFLPRRFTPKASVHKDQVCEGIDLMMTDRQAFDPVLMGLELLHATLKFHPTEFNTGHIIRLLGSDDAAARLTRGERGAAVLESTRAEIDNFRRMRRKYLLYD